MSFSKNFQDLPEWILRTWQSIRACASFSAIIFLIYDAAILGSSTY